MQKFCDHCRRIYNGEHNCRIGGPSTSMAFLRREWANAVKDICNYTCDHWGTINGSTGCTLSPTKPCDIGYYVRKGRGCFADPPRFAPYAIEFPEFSMDVPEGDLSVVTCAVGVKANELANYTLPRIRAYAERCGASCYVIRDDRMPAWPIANKLSARGVIERHNRTLYVDIDCFIRPTCPNVFQAFAPGRIWWFADAEMLTTSRRENWYPSGDLMKIGRECEAFDVRNTGVVLMDRIHAAAWMPPVNVAQVSNTLEQTAIEFHARDHGFESGDLPIEYNTQWWFREEFRRRFDAAHIIHLSAAPHAERIKILRRLTATHSDQG